MFSKATKLFVRPPAITSRVIGGFRFLGYKYSLRVSGPRDSCGRSSLHLLQKIWMEEEEECDLNQFLAATGSNYLPQVQTKSRDFASPPCLRLVFWNH